MRVYSNFTQAIKDSEKQLETQSKLLHPTHWQSQDITKYGKTGAIREVCQSVQTVQLPEENLDYYRKDIKPNLPWADDHFRERVCGLPLNPGKQWENWPYSRSANTHRTEGERFSHSYMERYWPKFANTLGDQDWVTMEKMISSNLRKGIRYNYGDLNDVVELLVQQPLTRQAYLPIWFPEDTGVVHKERVPCSLGYHFLYRDGALHCTYLLRSCDFVRHYRDDLYLTVRLLLWVLQELQDFDSEWETAKPGSLTTHIMSLHCFNRDWESMFGEEKKK